MTVFSSFDQYIILSEQWDFWFIAYTYKWGKMLIFLVILKYYLLIQLLSEMNKQYM